MVLFLLPDTNYARCTFRVAEEQNEEKIRAAPLVSYHSSACLRYRECILHKSLFGGCVYLDWCGNTFIITE